MRLLRPWTIAVALITIALIPLGLSIHRVSTRRILSISLVPHIDVSQARTVRFVISNACNTSLTLFHCRAEMFSGGSVPNVLDSAESVRVISKAGIEGTLIPGDSYLFHAVAPERGHYWRLHVLYSAESSLQPLLDWCRAKAQVRAPLL